MHGHVGGAEFEIRAANVVNATGVWADQIRPEELHDEEEHPAHPAEPRHAHHLRAARTCR